MRKTLRRVLERLRAATNGTFRRDERGHGALKEPQRMEPMLVPARSPARR